MQERYYLCYTQTKKTLPSAFFILACLSLRHPKAPFFLSLLSHVLLSFGEQKKLTKYAFKRIDQITLNENPKLQPHAPWGP